jgi:beta-glucosidase
LKGFKKILLQPGESKTVALDITPESLAFYGIDKKLVVEPGDFEIMIGNSSRVADLQKLTLTVTK